MVSAWRWLQSAWPGIWSWLTEFIFLDDTYYVTGISADLHEHTHTNTHIYIYECGVMKWIKLYYNTLVCFNLLAGDCNYLSRIFGVLSLKLLATDILVWHHVGGPLSRRSLCLFWRETKQRAWSRDLWRDWKWGKKAVGKGTQRGQLTKGDAERQSTTDSRRASRRERVQGQWGRRSKMSWHVL